MEDDDIKAAALALLDDVAALHGGWAGAIDALKALLQVDAELARMGEALH